MQPKGCYPVCTVSEAMKSIHARAQMCVVGIGIVFFSVLACFPSCLLLAAVRSGTWLCGQPLHAGFVLYTVNNRCFYKVSFINCLIALFLLLISPFCSLGKLLEGQQLIKCEQLKYFLAIFSYAITWFFKHLTGRMLEMQSSSERWVCQLSSGSLAEPQRGDGILCYRVMEDVKQHRTCDIRKMILQRYLAMKDRCETWTTNAFFFFLTIGSNFKVRAAYTACHVPCLQLGCVCVFT